MTKDIDVTSQYPASGHSFSGQEELHVLLKDCIARSRSAQKKLYDLYSADAYGIIKKHVYNNEPVAKEILNDAFFKIFRDLHQYSFQGAFAGWMRKIVVNTITDHLRKSMKDEHPTKEVEPEDAFVESGQLDHLSHKELLKIIDTLPEAQKEVFSLYVFENYSHKEIAKALNIQQNNCRWHLNDARRRLKEKLKFFMQ